MNTTTDNQQLTTNGYTDIEKAQARLAEISVKMNEQGLPLEQSLKLYGEAVQLIRLCKNEIEKAELEVKRLEQ